MTRPVTDPDQAEMLRQFAAIPLQSQQIRFRSCALEVVSAGATPDGNVLEDGLCDQLAQMQRNNRLRRGKA